MSLIKKIEYVFFAMLALAWAGVAIQFNMVYIEAKDYIMLLVTIPFSFLGFAFVLGTFCLTDLLRMSL